MLSPNADTGNTVYAANTAYAWNVRFIDRSHILKRSGREDGGNDACKLKTSEIPVGIITSLLPRFRRRHLRGIRVTRRR